MFSEKRSLAVTLSLIVVVFLVDVLVVRWFPLPAILYALFILVAARTFRPWYLAIVVAWDGLIVLVAAWLQSAPWDQVVLYESGLLVLGYFTIALSKRAKREAELKASMSALAEERQQGINTLTALIDALPVAVVVSDAAGAVTTANAGATSLFASANGQAAKGFRPEVALWHVDGRPLTSQEYPSWRCIQEGVSIKDVEVLARGGNGRGQTLLAAANPIRDLQEAIAGAVTVFQDVTEQRLTQAQLLEQQRALAALGERERLARELHDNLGQVLAYVSYQAESIRKLLADGYAVTADVQLSRLVEASQQAHTDVREHIIGLRMAVPHGRDLVATVDDYLRQFGENCGLGTDLVVNDSRSEIRVEPAAEVQLLRIIQEALTNVRKHAAANRVTIAFTCRGRWVKVAIEDNGRGFDVERLSVCVGGRYGLQIMRERAQEVGGMLQVSSAPDGGTKVIVTVPLRDREER